MSQDNSSLSWFGKDSSSLKMNFDSKSLSEKHAKMRHGVDVITIQVGGAAEEAGILHQRQHHHHHQQQQQQRQESAADASRQQQQRRGSATPSAFSSSASSSPSCLRTIFGSNSSSRPGNCAGGVTSKVFGRSLRNSVAAGEHFFSAVGKRDVNAMDSRRRNTVKSENVAEGYSTGPRNINKRSASSAHQLISIREAADRISREVRQAAYQRDQLLFPVANPQNQLRSGNAESISQADSLLELKGSGVKMRHRNKIRTTTDSGYQTTGPGNEQSSRSSDSPIYDLITENGSSPEPDFTFDSTGSVLSDEILEACKLPFLRSPERKGHNYKETSRVNEGATAMASPFGNNLMRRRYDEQESSDENEDHKSESISASATLEMEEQLKGMTQLLEMKGVINAKKSTQDKVSIRASTKIFQPFTSSKRGKSKDRGRVCHSAEMQGPDHGPVIRVPDTLEDRPKQGHNDASSNGNPGLPPHVPYHSASNSSRNSAEFLWSAATLDHRSISVDSSRTSGDPSEASDPSKNASSKYSWPKNRIVRQPKWLQDVPDKNIVEALKSRGVDGGFSIRRSQRGGDIQPYTLCVYHFKRVFKLEIRDENGCYSISQNPDMPSFEYLEDLVEHYRHNDLRLMRRTKEKFAGDANENTILIKLVD